MTITYGHIVTFADKPFAEVLELTETALKTQGFGIITEIDVKSTFKKKIDVDFRPYKILGACHPRFAHEALSGDLFVGLLLPCNVTVFENDDGKITVALAKPEELFKVVDRAELRPLAARVSGALGEVVAELKNQGGTVEVA